MPETEIQELIGTAIGQLAYSYAPYSGSAQPFWRKTAGFTLAVILRTQRTARQTVPRGRHFLRRSARACDNSGQSALWGDPGKGSMHTPLLAASAGR